jgi:integrase
MRAKLTRALIEGAEPDPKKDQFIWDEGKGSVTGFGFKLTPSGGRSFVLQYRVRGSAQDRRIKIGKYGDWTLDLARERARELKRDVDAGRDPIDQRAEASRQREEAKRLSVDRAFPALKETFLDQYEAGTKKNGRKRSSGTITGMKAALAHFEKHFGTKRIDQITAEDVDKAMDAIPAAQIAKRRNTAVYGEQIFGWALRKRLIAENPCALVEKPPVVATRERWLADDELALVIRATRRLAYPFGPFYRLLILTGQRRDEVAGMAWEELNHQAKEWRIPGDRTKNSREHIVPLSDAAVAEIEAALPAPWDRSKGWPRKGLVFTITGETAVSGFSRAKRRLDQTITVLADMEGVSVPAEWRIHDLRRTLATGLQRLGVRLEVTEAVLNHVSGSRGGIVGIYQRHDWAAEKREALADWAAHVTALNAPKGVRAESQVADSV